MGAARVLLPERHPCDNPMVMTLRQAASVIFALGSILPLLLFGYFMWRLNLVRSVELQIGLLLALLLAILGFVLFRRLTGRIATLGNTLRQPGMAGVVPPAAVAVPGLGPVSEITEIAQAFSGMLAQLRESTSRLENLVFMLGTLNDMVEMAAKIPKVEDLLSHVLERTMRAVSATIGSIMLLDRERQTLRVAVGRGLDDYVRAGVEVRVGEGIAGRVAKFGEPVLVEDIETDPRFGKTNEPKYGSGSFICIPLRVGDRIVGVVNLAKKEIGPGVPAGFNTTDLQFLNALVTYTAYAVDNARLFEEAQQAARRLRDVVEDQKLRLTLAQQQMLQAAKLSALGQLVAGVAHELNNPLQVLMGASEMLEGRAPPSVQTYVRMIREATDMARRVVDGLLAFGRRMPIERRRVDLRELFDSVLVLSVADLRLAGVTVEQDIAADLPEIWADRGRLQQVLLNLITNAKQAMAEASGERRLRITMRPRSPERVEIRVEDSGAGIAADVLPTIFDPFVTTKGPSGTGLGLSISYGIVREHEGLITVESQPGRGAVFTIDLPVGEPPSPGPAAATRPPLKGRRVLIVEDDESVREIMLGYLEQSGCFSATAMSADLAAMCDRHTDLVVADYDMAGEDWVSLLQTPPAREAEVGRRLLLLVSGPVPEDAQRGLEGAGASFLLKPFTREQFLDAVARVIH